MRTSTPLARLVHATAIALGCALLAVGLVGLVGAASRHQADVALRSGRQPIEASSQDWPGTHRDWPDATGTDEVAPTTASTTSVPAAQTTTTGAPIPRPDLQALAIRVPEVGIESPLVRLGLNPDNTLEVPDDFGLAGWYTHRAVPGEAGPAVIVGHVDSRSGPAIFYRIGELEPGSAIEVLRSDRSVARFTVTAKEQHDKLTFPTERVYGPSPKPELRLITCGGSFDHSTGHYRDNVIVFATLDRIVAPPR